MGALDASATDVMKPRVRSAWQGVVVLCVLLGVSTAVAAPVVLNPGQEASARALFQLERPDLGEGYSVLGLTLVADRVEVRIQGPSEVIEARLYPLEQHPRRALKTRSGALVLPEGSALPAVAQRALVARLESGQPLAYRTLQATPSRGPPRPPAVALDGVQADAEAQAIMARVARRLAGDAVDLPDGGLDAQVLEALQALNAGDDDRARSLLRMRLLETEERPPVGAISVWIAAGGLNGPEGCKPGVTCAMSEIRRTSSGHFSRINPQALGRLLAEPRALSILAAQLLEQGETAAASATLWSALATPMADPAAVTLARAWGWTDASIASGARLPDADVTRAASWTMPLVAAIAFLLACLWLALRLRTWRAIWLVLSLGCGLLTALNLVDEQRAPQPPAIDEGLLSLGRGGGCSLSAPWMTPSIWRATGRCEGRDVTLTVRRGAQPDERTGHDVRAIFSPSLKQPSPELTSWSRAFNAQVTEREALGWQLDAEVRHLRGTIKDKVAGQTPLMRRGLIVAAVIAAMALPALLFFLWQVWSRWTSPVHLPPHRRVLFGALLAGVVLTHLVAPGRMVMVFGGYDQVQHLAEAEALRYGPGAVWIYGPWLWLNTVDHTVVQMVNRGLGLIGLLLLWALAGRVVPGRPRVPLILAGMTVFAPLMWRDHASESLLVGGMLFGLAGLWGLAQQEDPLDWLLALPCLVLASLTRPEFALVLTALSLLLVLGPGRRLMLAHRWASLWLFVAVAAIGWGHYEVMAAWVDALRSSSALESVGLFELLWRVISRDTFEVVWRYGPLALMPFVIAAFWARSARGLVGSLFVIACIWAALTRIDLPQVSIPRVHAPIWLAWALIGAIGADHIVGRLMTQERSKRLLGGGLLVGLWCVTAAMTWPTLYAPTNEDAEEALIQDARGHLGDAPFGAIATILSQDPPPNGKASRAFPGYLFNQEGAPLVLSGLSELERIWPVPGGPVYALLGVRCYAEMREDTGAPAPKVAKPVKACADFRAQWRLEPIIERTLINRGDRAFPMYPDTETLDVGFYRVEGPR
ncbi:MAG: hypothetical protein ACPGU1_16005 [Myxococcota bacterium]